jgi:hypothetical protein
MYVNQFPQFIGLMSFVVLAAKGLFVLSCREIFQKLNLVKPFDNQISKLIGKISNEAFAIALLSASLPINRATHP